MSKVSAADPRPPYVQIADHLRAAMDAGDLAPGARLPSGRTLAEEYGVAAMTVQHAIRLLRDEGRLTTWQGRGVFVATTDQPSRQEEGVEPSDAARRLDQLERHMSELRERIATLESK